MKNKLVQELIEKIVNVIGNTSYENFKNNLPKNEYEKFIKEENTRIKKEIKIVLKDYNINYTE